MIQCFTTTLGGTLIIETNAGIITDSGVVTASGTSSFTTTTANDDISLNSVSSYTGAVSLSVNGAGGNAEIPNAAIALDLGTVTTTAGGTLIFETNAGSITDRPSTGWALEYPASAAAMLIYSHFRTIGEK